MNFDLLLDHLDSNVNNIDALQTLGVVLLTPYLRSERCVLSHEGRLY